LQPQARHKHQIGSKKKNPQHRKKLKTGQPYPTNAPKNKNSGRFCVQTRAFCSVNPSQMKNRLAESEKSLSAERTGHPKKSDLK
jgi:hypothetical protein